MPRVVEISRTKQGTFAVFCETGFLCALSASAFADAQLHEGDVITPQEAEELCRCAEINKAYSRALGVLAMREHGSQELYEKLCRHYDPHTAAETLGKLCSQGLVSDERFSGLKAAEMARRGKSSREIYQKLRALGLQHDLAQQAAQEQSPGDTERVLALLQKNYRGALLRGDVEKVRQALIRRGFSYKDIRFALQAMDPELEIAGQDDEFPEEP